MRVALAQMNQSVGDIAGNSRRISEAVSEADRRGAQVVVMPELALTGYPPEDLVLKSSFVDANLRALADIAAATGEVLAVVGFVDTRGGRLFDAAALCQRGRVLAVYHKHLLPNYGVFDERRYFVSGTGYVVTNTSEGIVGVSVCEDVWEPDGPVVTQGAAGAQVVLNINASPFHKGKLAERGEMLGRRAQQAGAAIVYVNMVGGQDELVFDGGSLVVDSEGEVLIRLPQFEECLEVVDVPVVSSAASPDGPGAPANAHIERLRVELRHAQAAPATQVAGPSLTPEEEIYAALRLALADYVRKNGFSKVVLGLSGGIDSSLTAAIAVDALGPERVLAVAMPSQFSTLHSVTDAKELAGNLGIEMLEVPIEGVYGAYVDILETVLPREDPALAEENLQARIRGNLLMFVSNRYGHLVIATGNKSESACGYATLYGDMAGGFSLIKDVFKIEVYGLARHRNSVSHVIPESVLTKAPSAELRRDQRDDDSLPPYDVLDPILEAYIEEEAGVEDIVGRGYPRDTVARVIALVDRAEYKRRQAPPGPKVTVKAFGRDRRLPISNAWREAEEQDLPPRVTGGRGPG